MVGPSSFDSILDAVRSSSYSGRALRQFAMAQLGTLTSYDWAGIYRLEGNHLELDAFVGETTEHTRIPVGRGVCGTAIAENKNVVVEDVRKLDNYLACSLETRSEIVVLIKSDDQILGQIDVDGHVIGAFGPEDEAFLSELASIMGKRWESVSPSEGTPTPILGVN